MVGLVVAVEVAHIATALILHIKHPPMVVAATMVAAVSVYLLGNLVKMVMHMLLLELMA